MQEPCLFQLSFAEMSFAEMFAMLSSVMLRKVGERPAATAAAGSDSSHARVRLHLPWTAFLCLTLLHMVSKKCVDAVASSLCAESTQAYSPTLAQKVMLAHQRRAGLEADGSKGGRPVFLSAACAASFFCCCRWMSSVCFLFICPKLGRMVSSASHPTRPRTPPPPPPPNAHTSCCRLQSAMMLLTLFLSEPPTMAHQQAASDIVVRRGMRTG